MADEVHSHVAGASIDVLPASGFFNIVRRS